MNAKNLLIIAHGLDGGIAPLASRLAFGLKSQNWLAHILYIGRPASNNYLAIDLQNGVSSEAVITGKARTIGEAVGLLRSVWRVWLRLKKQKPESIIFAGFIPVMLYAPLLRPLTRARFVFWDHAPQDTFLKIKQALFPLALAGLDAIASISPSSAKAMTTYFKVTPDKITIISNGCDPQPWQAVPPAPDFSALRVLMPARLELNQKDQPTLIRAAKILHDRGVNITLTVAGSGIHQAEIDNLIQSLKAQAYIKLVPHSSNLPKLMAQHNVVCLSTKFEGLGMVLVEAMLARRFAIASRVTGCVDVIEENSNGLLFTAGSAEDCADKLQSLQQNTELPAMLERAYQQALGKYDPARMIAAFATLLS